MNLIVLLLSTAIIIVFIVCLIYLIYSNYTNKQSTISLETSSILNDYFDDIVCIATPQRTKHMTTFFKKYGIRGRIYPAHMHTDKKQLIQDGFITNNSPLPHGRWNCHYSHMQVLKQFLENPYVSRLLIFEDDLSLREHSNPVDFNAFLRPYLESLPNYWNYLNMGGCWEYCKKTTPINDYWAKAYRPLCRHAIAFTKTGANIVNHYGKPMSNAQGDIMLGELIKKGILTDAYISRRILFRQDRHKFNANLSTNQNEMLLCENRKTRI